jgi:hypothetical protein
MEDNVMNLKLFLYPPVRVSLLIAASGLLLASCVPALFSPAGQADNITTTSAYPPPATVIPAAPPPLPTQADGRPNFLYSYFATPAPNETMGVAEVLEISPEIILPSQYSVESQPVTGGPEYWRAVYVVDSITGDKVRLGNDSGSAVYGAMNDDILLWFFRCDSCEDVAAGLHAYWLRTGKDNFIAENVYSAPGSSKIAGQWVTYLKPPERPSRYSSQLYAYNLQTGQNVLIATDAVYMSERTASYNAINEDQVAWIATGPTVNDWTLHVYDLTTQTAQQLEIDLIDARYLSVSRNLVVWWDVFWKGYDLTRDALFTIPVVPPGWENVPIHKDGPVTAMGNQLYWLLEVNGEEYYFTAPVIPKDEAPPTVQPIPTPIGLPTLAPPRNTPTMLPTTYP